MEVTLLLCTMISNYAKLWNIVILLLLSHLIRFTYHLTCFLPLGNITKQLFCQVRTAVGKQTHYRPSHRSTCPLGKEETVEKVTISYDPKKKKNTYKKTFSFHKTAAKDMEVSMYLTALYYNSKHKPLWQVSDPHAPCSTDNSQEVFARQEWSKTQETAKPVFWISVV